MTDRDRPVPGQGPEAWRAGHAGAPDLLELQATDALLDRLALRLPTGDDLADPLALALAALTTEVDAGLPAERRNGRGPRLNGAANGHRTNGHANGHSNGHANGHSNGHTFGYADLRSGLNGHRPEGPAAGSGRNRDGDLGLQGYEIVGDGGELRPQPQRPTSLGDWKDRLLDLATRKPMAVLGAAAATVGIMFGAVLVGQNFGPLPTAPLLPGATPMSDSQLNGINNALRVADVAVREGQVGNARKALDDAERAVERLPQSPEKERYRTTIKKLRITVETTAAVPSSGSSGSSGQTAGPVATASVTTNPSSPVTSSPATSPSNSPSTTTTVTDSPNGVTTTPTVSVSGTVQPGGEDDPEPTSTSTDGGVIPGGGDDPAETTTTTTAP